MSRKGQQHKSDRYGFDYGSAATALAVSSIEFNKNLVEAEVLGVAYGIAESNELGLVVPSISLIARNQDPLRKAFDEFSTWAEASDGDAIEVTIVFTKDGGYRLCINPEVRALIKRALPHDSVMNPIAFQLMWIKTINTTSQPLRDLRAHLSKGVRPFLLQAGAYAGLAAPGRQLVPELVRPVASRKELLKFEIKFIDEGDDDDRHLQDMALGRLSKRKGSPKKVSPPTGLVWVQREQRLRTLFPVSMWRIKTREELRRLSDSLVSRGLRPWQVDQALCNIAVSRETTGGKAYFQGWEKKEWPGRLLAHLSRRFEVAGSHDDGLRDLQPAEVELQVLLDAKALLNEYGHKGFRLKLDTVQTLLKKQGLLDASTE